MTNKKTSPKEPIAVEEVYNFPELGVSIAASSLEEATKKALALDNKGDKVSE